MINEENLIESLQENIMYPMVKQLHEYVKKHLVLFLRCQMDKLPKLFQAQAGAGGSPHSDKRGRHEPQNKISQDKIKIVKEHIDSFQNIVASTLDKIIQTARTFCQGSA